MLNYLTHQEITLVDGGNTNSTKNKKEENTCIEAVGISFLQGLGFPFVIAFVGWLAYAMLCSKTNSDSDRS